jgi:hypothetical protein
MDAAARILKPNGEQGVNIEEIEEGCTGHDSRRAAQLRLSHTPQADTNFKS